MCSISSGPVPIVDPSALYHNTTLFADVPENSLFSVFREGKQIFDTLKAEHLEAILVKEGANVNEKEKESGMNFLQRCIVEEFSLGDSEGTEFAKIVKLLFTRGIDINHQDSENRTALHLAVSEDEFDLVKLLVEQGANRSIVDGFGKTAYDYLNDFNPSFISESYAKEREEMLKLLKP